MNSTSSTLLARLRERDNSVAWGRFVELYSPVLFHWARHLGLQDADAADLVQDVFLVLVRKLADFEYDRGKSFRAWLKTVITNKFRDRCRSRQISSELVAVEDLSDPRYDLPGGKYEQLLIQSALGLIRTEFTLVAWTAFERYELQGQEPNRVATDLEISVATVYATKSKVLRRLRDEIGDFRS